MSIRMMDVGRPEHVRDILVMPASAVDTSPLAWSADDRELIVSRLATIGGTPTSANSPLERVMTLWALDVITGQLRVLSEPLGPIAGATASPDGRHLAITAGYESSELWALENATVSLAP